MPAEQTAPELERIVSQDQEIEMLGSGYNLAEGPLWWKEGGYLLFSDMFNSRRMKWAPGDGVTLFHEPTDNANGLTRDLQGRLIACQHGTRSVTRMEHDGSITVVADSYQGKLLNHPNDVVVKSDGSIYFTDPGGSNVDSELGFSGVHRVSPDLGDIEPVVRDFALPNGLTFSPDESVLYINDTIRRHIRAFDVQPNGLLDLASDRVFCELRGEQSGIPDGMKVDVEGNVYCTGPGGVWIMNASGQHLGTILTGGHTTNVAWGDDDWKTLYFTTGSSVGRIRLKILGIPVPRGPLAGG